MIRFLQLVFCFCLCFFSFQNLKAQSSVIDEKINIEEEVLPLTVGFKKQSDSQVLLDSIKNQNIKEDTDSPIINKQQLEDQAIEINKNILPEINSVLADYYQMPFEVQSKMDVNKANGKPVLEGVLKGYHVEIKSCISENEMNRILDFLSEVNGFVNCEFVSNGLIKINVQCNLDTDPLEEIMIRKGIIFNFLDEFYFIKN